jgi:5-methylcytosine-specific restriction enzyme A
VRSQQTPAPSKASAHVEPHDPRLQRPRSRASRRQRSAVLRRQVYQRDEGICALCGCDTEFAREVMFHALRHLGTFAEVRARSLWREVVQSTGLDSYRASWWEADHTLPICEGGADELSNLRTLCLACHKEETAALQKRRAQQRQLLEQPVTGR